MGKEKILKLLAFGVWGFLAYLHLALAVLFRIVPRLRKTLGNKFETRMNFEKKNQVEDGCKSFYLSNETAKICFQVASEGEFEQIRWLVEELIKSNQLIEIIFTSPSVEHRVIKMYQENSQLLRYLRTPLVTLSTHNLSHWITAPSVVMVRYDFYPMLLSLSREKKLILLWFFRPRDRKNIFSVIKWNLILPLFELIVASNTDDWWWLRAQVDYRKLMPSAIDLRSLSIFDRLDKCNSTLDKCNSTLDKYFEHFSSQLFPIIQQHPKSIIHGNAYTVELNYLSDLNWKNAIIQKNILLAIVAHHPESINKDMISENYQLPCYQVTSGMKLKDLSAILEKWNQTPGIFLFSGKGFLLELYSLFKVALVGGGFKQDTHSILEPYLAGAMVYCGPNVYRSSEYFQIKDLDGKHLNSLATIEQWKCDCLNKILSMDSIDMDLERNSRFVNMRQSLIQQSKVLFQLIGIK